MIRRSVREQPEETSMTQGSGPRTGGASLAPILVGFAVVGLSGITAKRRDVTA